jgi:[ribosomal protein S5]-alanine N-acetyltransferase
MTAKLKYALIFQDNNYIGPEYYFHLNHNNYKPDLIIAVGKFTASQDNIELERTKGLWQKKIIPKNEKIYKFKSCKDNQLWELISKNNIDLIIQGGAGFIFTRKMISSAKIGVLNIHPGKLPNYRGNSAPEWAIYSDDEVYLTAHMIDEGIDTGPIIKEKILNYRGFDSYYKLRANIYAHCSEVLIDSLEIINKNIPGGTFFIKQKEDQAKYWSRISESKLIIVKNKFVNFLNLNLSLKILKSEDIDPNYLDWFADSDVLRYSDNQYRKISLNNCKNYVDECFMSSNVDLYGIFSDKLHIGNIAIIGLDSPHRKAEITYVIGKSNFWGKGIASFAVSEIIEKAKKKYKLHKLFAGVANSNYGSIKVLEKNGFVLEGERLDHLFYGNKFCNQLDFGIILFK